MKILAGYLKLQSSNPSDFKGDSKDRDHPGWIEVLDVSFATEKRTLGPMHGRKRSELTTYTLFVSKSPKHLPDISEFSITAIKAVPLVSVVFHIPGKPGHRFEFGGAASVGSTGAVTDSRDGPTDEFAIDFEAAYYRAGAASLPNAASSAFSEQSTAAALKKLHELRQSLIQGT
jgi:hypothetical protein